MQDGPSSFFKSWEGFLPPNAVVMAKVVERTGTSNRDSAVISCLIEAPGVSGADEKALLAKILSALSLSEESVRIEERIGEKAHVARLCIRFVLDSADSAGAGEWGTLPDESGGMVPALSTYSLSAMLREPGLKKPVWLHLKAAIARLEREQR